MGAGERYQLDTALIVALNAQLLRRAPGAATRVEEVR